MKQVKVKWIDSCGGDCYWLPLADFKPSIMKPISFGFVIYEDDECISLAQTYAEESNGAPEQINAVITIPKVSILEMNELFP